MLENVYGCNLRKFKVSWDEFPPSANVCGLGQEPTPDWTAWKVLHSGKLWPYVQTLDKAGKACQVQTLHFIMSIRKLQP